ncbi:MAG TPA: fasciclin domain-containing protein [Candidatus Paceibacterota bacterium]|nr:fasciclin domain-containing protein [Candidatus Paceibacterota bacterium]
MNENNTWGWVIGIVVVLIIIGGVWWWMSSSTPAAPVTSATTASTTPDTSGTQASPVAVSSHSSQTVSAIVAGLSGASEYESYLGSTGVGSSITGKGPYTIFVSTDAGYALLKPGTIVNMTAAQKKRLIQYSIVSGKELDVDVQNSGSVKALSGDELNFKVSASGSVQVNSSYALAAYKASNGIVYVVNQPLIPPTSGNILTP